MDKPPEHKNAEIVPLFRQYEPKSPEQSPKPPSARIVELPDAPRRQSSDEYSDASLEEPQGAEIIEFPSTPTSLRQQASELIGKVLAGEEKEHSSDPQHEKIDKKEAAKTIAELLAKAHEKLDDNPRNNCTIELGRLVMALAAHIGGRVYRCHRSPKTTPTSKTHKPNSASTEQTPSGITVVRCLSPDRQPIPPGFLRTLRHN